MNLRERISQAQDIKVEAVDVPEWGVTVYVSTFNGHERATLMELREKCLKAGRISDLAAHLAVFGCCEANGQRMFTESDFDFLQTKSATALDRIAEVALRLNGLLPEAKDKAKN